LWVWDGRAWQMPEDIPVYNGPMNLFDIPNYLVHTKIPLIPIPAIPLLQVN